MDELMLKTFGDRVDEDGVIRKYGLIKSFGIDDGEEYKSICKAYGRNEDTKEGKAAPPYTDFKKERFMTFVSSDETRDSYGDILRVAGCDLSRYNTPGASNFISSHDIGNIFGACGIMIKSTKGKNEGSPNGVAVSSLVYFPTEEEDPDADRVYKKYKARTLNAVSVGFQPLEWKIPSSPEEAKKIGLGPHGIEFLKWMPYELSAVTVGANPNALAKRSVAKIRAEIEAYNKIMKPSESVNIAKQVGDFFAANPIRI